MDGVRRIFEKARCAVCVGEHVRNIEHKAARLQRNMDWCGFGHMGDGHRCLRYSRLDTILSISLHGLGAM